MAIEIERHEETGGIRLVVRGDVDMTTGGRLVEAIRQAEDDGTTTLTVDLRGVDFFDSTGVQIVLDADVRAADAGRRLVVVPGDGEAGRVLTLAQVLDRLDVAVAD
jgi:anti-sigma B factor antagonist